MDEAASGFPILKFLHVSLKVGWKYLAKGVPETG